MRLEQIVQRSPLLAQLAQQAGQAARLLELVRPLLPVALRSTVQAGPVEGEQWCLIVPNSAAAAKLRHLSPDLLAHLQAHWQAQRAASAPGQDPASALPTLPRITQLRLRIGSAQGQPPVAGEQK
ncbi:DUF721 domain-containing protein [Corticibacter populi]|uniref:DUF721 domain-containing protein n=2 Tax=Corticibacter populi TaxID=1550736 RepID=A0A3M6QK37_9BURK|nr:DUF721 domain-containing protein [Corticibacter populi]